MDKKILKLFKTIFTACQDGKGIDIKTLDLNNVGSYTDYVVVCSASSDRQVIALADRVLKSVSKDCSRSPLGVEGYDTAEWILIDFGDAICHIFLEEIRPDYHIETMWPQVQAMDEQATQDFLKSPEKKSKKTTDSASVVLRKQAKS